MERADLFMLLRIATTCSDNLSHPPSMKNNHQKVMEISIMCFMEKG